jgi:hypothetical protein
VKVGDAIKVTVVGSQRTVQVQRSRCDPRIGDLHFAASNAPLGAKERAYSHEVGVGPDYSVLLQLALEIRHSALSPVVQVGPEPCLFDCLKGYGDFEACEALQVILRNWGLPSDVGNNIAIGDNGRDW